MAEGVRLEAIGLTQVFRTGRSEIRALQGLELRVDPGETVGVVGASGSGKSTLVRAISGLLAPTGGRVEVDGEDLAAFGRRRLERHRRDVVGFVWQSAAENLLPELTARENITMPLRLAGVEDADDRAAHLLDRLGLTGRAERRPAELSGGEQQRIALAVAIGHRPRLLLADEPTGALDRAATVEMFSLMRELAAESGTTQLIVSHDAELARHVDRVIGLRDGRVATERRAIDGTTEEVLVVDDVGRLQLDEAHWDALGRRDRLRATVESDAVILRPVEQPDDGVEP